jgi:hypothetical protein
MRQALRGASLLFTALEFTGITRADDRIDKPTHGNHTNANRGDNL